MANNSWMDSPILSDISEEKMEILTKIIEGGANMEPRQMLTYFMQESNRASQKGIYFSDNETDLILNVLTENMSPSEIRKINSIRRMVNTMSKRRKR